MEKNWFDKSIMIVDDDEMNHMLLKAMLERTKVNITSIKKISSFFKSITEKKHDLILMDLNLNQDLNGIDLINYMKKNNNKTPIIVQSGSSDDYSASELRCDDILLKPLKMETLISKIGKIFGR